MFSTRLIRNAVIVMTAWGAALVNASGVLPDDPTLEQWQEPALALSLPGGAGDSVTIGDYYQVLVTAKSTGHLYLIQQNSQERANGKVRLVAVTRALPGYSQGSAFMYPAHESLEAAPPLGMSRVQAVYTNRPLFLGSDAGVEQLLTEAELAGLIEEAKANDPGLLIARETVTYEVALAEGELEHTTRGIAKQINTAITSADLEPDNDGVLTSFDAHIQFEFGSAVPTFNGQLQLDAFGDVLTREDFSHIQFVVAGHTDDIGTREFNLDLSEARAKAVAEYLEQNYGITNTRMVVEALGEDAPYVANSDRDSRALNRRVEFTLLD